MKKLFIALTVSLFSLSSFAASLSCAGTEPFWGLKVNNGKMTFSSPDAKAVTVAVTSTTQAAGFAENNTMIIKSKFTRLSVIAGDCSDGMSEDKYTHHAIFEKDGVVFGGCCNLQ